MEVYPGCNEFRLDNGLTVITEQIEHSKTISLGIWFNSGSRDEDREQNGVTHLIEHLAFRGTSSRGADEISSTVDKLGGRINAGTSREYMVFYLDCLAQGLKEAVSLLSDIALNPLFRQQDLELERNVVIEEIRSGQDNPRSEVFHAFQEALWGSDRGLSLRITGTEGSVSRITKDQVSSRFTEMRRPENMVLAMAGSFDLDQVIASAEKYFSNLEPGSGNSNNRHQPTPVYEDRAISRDINQTHFCLGTEGLDKGDQDKFVLEILNVILGTGMHSRLFRKIRKDLGLAYQIASDTEYYSDTGYQVVYAATDAESLSRVKEAIIRELRTLVREPVTTEELELAKAKTKGNLVLGLEGNQANMVRLAGSVVYDEPLETVETLLDRIDQVTKEDVRRIADKIYNPDQFATSVLGPQE
ncbi:MAG: M16 family metallopeptidase [Candidatus Bipolaricaulota bacterium]